MEKILIQFLLANAQITGLASGQNLQPLAEDQDLPPPYIVVQMVKGRRTTTQKGAEGTRFLHFFLICHGTTPKQASDILEALAAIVDCESGTVTVDAVTYTIRGIFVEDEETDFDPPVHGDQVGDPSAHKLLLMVSEPQ